MKDLKERTHSHSAQYMRASKKRILQARLRRTCLSLLPCFGSIPCLIRSAPIHAFKNFARKRSRECPGNFFTELKRPGKRLQVRGFFCLAGKHHGSLNSPA